jgi:hypothetical protein
VLRDWGGGNKKSLGGKRRRGGVLFYKINSKKGESNSPLTRVK